jgi:polysaccharide export outer membrane protein
MFFVAGEVQAPGSFPLKPGTTVRQAISLARGFTFSAAKGRSLIFREEAETGSRKEIKVDLGEVMSGKQDDIPLLANDIIIVPNSRLKSVGGAILNAFGTNVVTRGVRY